MASNPPAFPRTGEGFGNSLYDTPGMSLRDWFAGQALASVLSAPSPRHLTAATHAEQNTEWVARACYLIADAMLAERERS